MVVELFHRIFKYETSRSENPFHTWTVFNIALPLLLCKPVFVFFMHAIARLLGARSKYETRKVLKIGKQNSVQLTSMQERTKYHILVKSQTPDQGFFVCNFFPSFAFHPRTIHCSLPWILKFKLWSFCAFCAKYQNKGSPFLKCVGSIWALPK